MGQTLNNLKGTALAKPPINLFDKDNHSIWWVGINEDTAFRSNVYLIKNGNNAILVDPGHRAYFEPIKLAISQILDPKDVCALLLCHQDPDVCASMTDWIDFNPNITIISTSRTHVLLPYYGKSHYNRFDASDDTYFELGNAKIRFIESPFMHFPGAFTTYDETSKFLLSGDIWAAIDADWKIVVDNFEHHISMLDLFHKDYIASNIACRGFLEKLENIDIEAILPQHGSIIARDNVQNAKNYLENLNCGLDIIYPHLGM